MALRKAIATPAGQPTKYVDLTPAENAARNAEIAAINAPSAVNRREEDAIAATFDVALVVELLVTGKAIPQKQLDAIAARQNKRAR